MKDGPRPPRGEGWVWTSGAALAFVLGCAAFLMGVLAAHALPVFWPAPLAEVTLADGTRFYGTPLRTDADPADGGARRQFRAANRDIDDGADFRWIRLADVAALDFPETAWRVERTSHGDLHGRLIGVDGPDAGDLEERFAAALAGVRRRMAEEEAPRVKTLAAQSDRLRDLRMAILKADYRARPDDAEALRRETETVQSASDVAARELQRVRASLRETMAVFTLADGRETRVALADIVRADAPNRMGFFAKCGYAGWKLKSLLTDAPREANTEGGLLPAIFGTVFLVMFMAAFAFPLGVTAGIYLREYARDTWFTRLVRVAVNNLAGIPSIVYGIFGLGFFVYGLGGGIDAWLYPERVEAGITTYGTGGVLWAGLTLGLLTLPVVIVATEEALASVPADLRQGALALGATPWQTLWRVSLPMASPGILTGFILAMARAAGEVAPLMLTGVVKSAPALAVDGSWPFFHPERKFMHLGFFLYDIGFQSPNVEAARPMVYVTALLLLFLVFGMNLAAIRLRNAMRRRYAMRGL